MAGGYLEGCPPPLHNPVNGHTPTLQYKTLPPLRIKTSPFHKKQRAHTHANNQTYNNQLYVCD